MQGNGAENWMAGTGPATRNASEPHDGVAAAIGLIIDAAAAPHDIAIAVDANAAAGQGADIGAGADDAPGTNARIDTTTAVDRSLVDAAWPSDDGPLVGAAGPPHDRPLVGAGRPPIDHPAGCLGTLDKGAVLDDPADIAVDETAGGEGEARQADAQ